jgi:hypothetical protein
LFADLARLCAKGRRNRHAVRRPHPLRCGGSGHLFAPGAQKGQGSVETTVLINRSTTVATIYADSGNRVISLLGCGLNRQVKGPGIGDYEVFRSVADFPSERVQHLITLAEYARDILLNEIERRGELTFHEGFPVIPYGFRPRGENRPDPLAMIPIRATIRIGRSRMEAR